MTTDIPSSEADLHSLVGAFALNALDDLETRRFENHLASCANCAVELNGLRESVELFIDDAEVPAEDVPESLRARVMAEIDQTAQDPTIHRRAAANVPTTSVSPTTPPGADRRSRRRLRLVAAAAATVAVIAGAWFFAANDTNDRSDEIAAVVNDPDASVVLLSTDSAEVTVATVDNATAVIESDGLPDLGSDLTYQLWLIADGTVTPSITFAAADAADRLLFDFDAPLPKGALLAISVEPSGGSTQPTTDPIAISEPI